MQVTREIQSILAILTLRGNVVAEELDLLEDHIRYCIKMSVVRVVLDFREVPFLDSAALEELQNIASELGKRGGDLRVASLNDVCSDIFLATRMESFIHVSPNRDVAIGSLL